jgi:isocitrate dehydrogenase
MAYDKIKVPANGEKITMGADGKLNVPDHPIITYIEGDGTGPDITKASMMIWNAAVEKAYGGKRKIEWMEVLAGEKAFKATGEWLPQATLDACRENLVSFLYVFVNESCTAYAEDDKRHKSCRNYRINRKEYE